MSLMDKIKAMFAGGSTDDHDHSGHDHAGHDHSHDHEPAVPPLPPADPALTPTSDVAPDSESENRPA